MVIFAENQQSNERQITLHQNFDDSHTVIYCIPRTKVARILYPSAKKPFSLFYWFWLTKTTIIIVFAPQSPQYGITFIVQ